MALMHSQRTVQILCDLFQNSSGSEKVSTFPADGWYVIGRVGMWRGHPAGAFELSPSDFASVYDYFETRYRSNAVDVVVDFDHQSREARRAGIKAPAAAWIDAMDLRADGNELWAHVKWTENARDLLGRKEYRYLSPVYVRNFPDPTTGKRVPWILDSVALTNRPYMTELPAVVNSSDNAEGSTDNPPVAPEQNKEENLMDLLKLLAAALGIEIPAAAEMFGVAEDASVEDVVKAIVTKLKPAEAAPEAAAVENAIRLAGEATARENALKTDMLVVVNSLGLPAESTRDDVLKRIGELFAGAKNDRATLLIENAIAAGKIAPANKGTFVALASANYDETQTLVNSLPVVIAPRTKPNNGPAPSFKKDPKKEFENSVELQEEFGGDVAAYEAYLEAEEKGIVSRVAKV